MKEKNEANLVAGGTSRLWPVSQPCHGSAARINWGIAGPAARLSSPKSASSWGARLPQTPTRHLFMVGRSGAILLFFHALFDEGLGMMCHARSPCQRT